MYKRILITGANGLLGQQLVRVMGRLPQYDVLATGRDMRPRFSGGSCGYTVLDITDSEAVSRLFDDFEPDVVINCAAMTQVDECEVNREACWQVNAAAVETIAKNCRNHGSHLVQVSTDFVFDGKLGPYKESARPSPINYYGKAKLAVENNARGAGINQWSIVRTVLVFGECEMATRSNFVSWVKSSLSARKELRIVNDQWRTPTYAPDLARGIERLIRFGKNGVYHLSGREYVSVFEFAVLVANTLGLDKSLLHQVDGSSFSQEAERPLKTGFIVLKAETELGYNPLSLKDAILEMEGQGENSSL